VRHCVTRPGLPRAALRYDGRALMSPCASRRISRDVTVCQKRSAAIRQRSARATICQVPTVLKWLILLALQVWCVQLANTWVTSPQSTREGGRGKNRSRPRALQPPRVELHFFPSAGNGGGRCVLGAIVMRDEVDAIEDAVKELVR
jgi:hypothetical protein